MGLNYRLQVRGRVRSTMARAFTGMAARCDVLTRIEKESGNAMRVGDLVGLGSSHGAPLEWMSEKIGVDNERDDRTRRMRLMNTPPLNLGTHPIAAT